MAQVPDGTLMQRAAAGLASVCAGVLRTAQGGGRIYGSRVVVLAGTGDNGGDALYAGALLARRGASVTAILAGSRAHEGGRDALRSAGGRVIAIVPWAAGAASRAASAAALVPPATSAQPALVPPPPPPTAPFPTAAPSVARQPPPPTAATRVNLPQVRRPAAVPPGTPETRVDMPRAHFEPKGPAAIRAEHPEEADDVTRPDIGRMARFAPGHDVRHAIGHADLIIDGLLGIGGQGGLREPYATLAHYAANSTGVTVAVDLPSGIDASTGAVDGPAVMADVTVTFGACKPGLLIDPGARHAGVVEVVDIGLGPHLDLPDASAPQAEDIAALIPKPGPESDKYRRGVVGLLAGSDRYTGAAILATGGAVRGGAGMVRLVTAQRAADAVRLEWPEAVITPTSSLSPGPARAPGTGTGPAASGPGSTAAVPMEFPASVGRVQAWVVGPGMGTSDEAAERLAAVLRTGLPVLVDADGLTLLSLHPGLLPRSAPTLLTPHAGELGRLLGADAGEVERRRLEHARAAARKLGACVLLKGSTTVVAQPGDRDPVLVNTTGTPWLATAGTGDVLSGLAGALLAQGLLPPQAAIAAAYLHGLAARLAAAGAGMPAEEDLVGEAPLGASDVMHAIPLAFRSL
jgi:hydroxyethylthiazole kinase-like uncharacterized protein yjeF